MPENGSSPSRRQRGRIPTVAPATGGEGFAQKRVAAFTSAIEADPQNVKIIDARGIVSRLTDYDLAPRSFARS
jgi:hypothetical protein